MQNFGDGTAGGALTWIACKEPIICLFTTF
jgi:hypothetical protein